MVNPSAVTARGFIVSAWQEAQARGAAQRVLLTGRLESTESFAALVRPPPPALLVHARDEAAACTALGLAPGSAEEWEDLAGAKLSRLVLPHRGLHHAERLLQDRGLGVVERERGGAQDTLLALGLQGPVLLEGPSQPGRRVDLVFVEPKLSPDPAPAPAEPRWLALDLETDRQGGVVAASLAGHGGPGEVLFLGPKLGVPSVTSFASEATLLSALARRIVARDPDVITGWNVLDFDFRVLAKRFAACNVPFAIGRTDEPAAFVERASGPRLHLPGRAVLDGMRLVRASGERHEELSLQAVAQTVLGEGKSVAVRGEAKLRELERLRFEAPEELCAYCLRDSELVLRILEKTGLGPLTARRAALTGVPLELAWTSIPAFERIYAGALRERRVIPPPRQEARVSGAAGGTVLEPATGLFDAVLVFDFRSLYPSIIRTFNIDPRAHARALANEREGDLVAPNGARFEREAGLLPTIIDRYASEREAAIARGDEIGSYVYKILQNSFYGVLGSGDCRYGKTELAGAITSFGHLFLTAARDFFAARGLRVLYGDTDSVFVLSGAPASAGYDALTAQGAALGEVLNQELTARISSEWGVRSRLRIRCEKAYRRFFIPRLRGAFDESDGEKQRGRAKGYAGERLLENGATELEVKGMEAVRSDITLLARRFQVELLGRLFRGDGEAQLAGFCRERVAELWRGQLDPELVYKKSLRRNIEEYGSETPAVKAARLLGWTGRRGKISYVITVHGPEPLEARSGAPLDHAHYRDKQLLPIARSVAELLGADAEDWLGSRKQLELGL